MKQKLVAFALLLPLAGCGYHQVGAATHIPADVRTVSVPIFQSKVQGYNTEVAFTEAVVRELNTRTRYRVLTDVNASSSAINHPMRHCGGRS
jgi:Lipopolysaccharide-assembly